MKQLLSLLFLVFTFISSSFAQEDSLEMRVFSCTAIPEGQIVYNIFVDENNTKWVGTDKGLFRINSPDNATQINLQPNQFSLLRQTDGNANFILNKSDFPQLPNPSFIQNKGDYITTSFYNKKSKRLYFGTHKSGVLVYAYKNEIVKFIKKIDTSNSKIKSNHINCILVDKFDRTWIGTKAGVLFQPEKNKKWKLFEKDSDIISITPLGVDVWIFSKEMLWKVEKDGKWYDGKVEPKTYSGEIKNIAFDRDAHLWVASNYITRYQVVDKIIERFDRSNGFDSREINCIKLDQDNALWVGTNDKGLYLIEKSYQMTVSVGVDTPLPCSGFDNTASLNVKIIGGEPPYAIEWNNGLEGRNPKNIGPGEYDLTVTDSQGKTKKVAALIEDNRLKVELIHQTSSINGADATAELKIWGGVKPYKIKWDNGEKKKKALALSGGNHSVIVTDGSGCAFELSVFIKGGQLVKDKTLPLTIIIQKTKDISCGGQADGALEVVAQGGQKPYKYKWRNKGTNSEIKDISEGKYSVTVTDKLGKSISKTFTIKEPQALVLKVNQTQKVSNRKRKNGEAKAIAIGGTGKLKFVWDDGQFSSVAKNLGYGTHNVTVTDSKNCEATASVNINTSIASKETIATAKVKKGQIFNLDKIYFKADSTEMEVNSYAGLVEVIHFLKKNPKAIIEIGGHTNNIPKDEYCDRLSKARAKSVATYIVKKGISKNRVLYKGYGKRKPIATNKTKQGRKENQRVEIKILEL